MAARLFFYRYKVLFFLLIYFMCFDRLLHG